MNFSEFSFWWILLLFSVPFLTVRYFAKSLNLWQDLFDALGLAFLSALLFFSASRTSFAIFICDIIFNYLMVRWMLRAQGDKSKLVATALIIVNVSILAYFKYLSFFVENVVGYFIPLHDNWRQEFFIPVKTTIPPGVSFFTFHMIAFVVDSYAAKKKQPIRFLDYLNFVSFFPQLVAGPIERRRDLLPQIERFRFKFTVDNIENGFRWLSLGLFMKFVLAENIAPYIDLKITDNAWTIWLFSLLFTLRIYFDFGGYSFIAVGIASCMGVKLTLNFLAPYTSQSINEFWRRWHITLSTWFRDYVFIPLMGSNKQWAPFYLFLTFTLSGFWHGAAWNFIIWGAYHGALLLILRYLGRPFYGFVGRFAKQPQFISWLLTFGSVVFGCLFFMESNNHRLITKLKTLLTPSAYSWQSLLDLIHSYDLNQGVALIVVLTLAFLFLLMEHIAVWQQKFEYELLLSRWVSPILLGLTVLLAANTPSQFIYFEF
jgi:D-alanyl-lipoteichoic acid acyltransferase DltB (MBOAT superfamily)